MQLKLFCNKPSFLSISVSICRNMNYFQNVYVPGIFNMSSYITASEQINSHNVNRRTKKNIVRMGETMENRSCYPLIWWLQRGLFSTQWKNSHKTLLYLTFYIFSRSFIKIWSLLKKFPQNFDYPLYKNEVILA